LGAEVLMISNSAFHINQKKQITKLLYKSNMFVSNAISILMVIGSLMFAYGDHDFHSPSLYQSIVGSLQYAFITYLEFSYAINKVSQFMQHPTEVHWKEIKRILHYLCGTLDYEILIYFFNKPSHLELVDFSDIDWATDVVHC